MRRACTVAMVTMLALSVLVVSGCSRGAATTPTVSISSSAFSPANLTIKAGDTVTWTNSDNAAHTVTGADFDSGGLVHGEKYSHTFDKTGTFDYACRFHPSMMGRVTVQ